MSRGTKYCDIITELCQLNLPGAHPSNWERKCGIIASYKSRATLGVPQSVEERSKRRMGGRGRTRRQGKGEDERTRQANRIEVEGRENGKYANVGNGSMGVNVSQEV